MLYRYNIKEKINKKSRYNRKSLKKNSENSDDISNELRKEKINEFNNKSAASVDMPSSLSKTSYRDSSQVAVNNKGKQNNINSEKIASLTTIKNVTLIILVFDIFLIIISLIFLILEINEFNYLKKIIELFQTFKIFKRGIENTPSSLVPNYNFIYGVDNKTKNIISINIYEDYSNSIMLQFPSMNSLPKISKLIQVEISQRYSYVLESFNKYLAELFKLTNKVIETIKNLPSISVSITKQQEKLLTHVSTNSFISICREYNNNISSLLSDNIYFEQKITLLNNEMIDELNYQVHFHYDFELNYIIKNMIFSYVLYPTIHSGLFSTSLYMEQELYSSINLMEKYTIIYFIIFLSLHIILTIIMICFFIIYLKLLKKIFIQQINYLWIKNISYFNPKG